MHCDASADKAVPFCEWYESAQQAPSAVNLEIEPRMVLKLTASSMLIFRYTVGWDHNSFYVRNKCWNSENDHKLHIKDKKLFNAE